MKRFIKLLTVVFVICSILGVSGYIYYKKTYPYGHTHRCSKGFAADLHFYATENGGRYPNFVDGDKLLVADYVGDSDYNLEMVIGKTVDFEAAKQFYQKHGYLLSQHSAWQFVNGVEMDHTGRAFAWDKIPLGHNGQVETFQTREVVETGFSVSNISNEQWSEYLNRQQSTNWDQ